MFIKEGTIEIKDYKIKVTDEVKAILTEVKENKFNIKLISKKKNKKAKDITTKLRGKTGIRVYENDVKKGTYASFSCIKENLEEYLNLLFKDIVQDRKFRVIYKKALEKGKVYIEGLNPGNRNGITKYNVYILNKDGSKKYIKGYGGYWSDNLDYYTCCVWGTSRPLEIILSIGYALGLNFSEIQQNYRIIY